MDAYLMVNTMFVMKSLKQLNLNVGLMLDTRSA